MERFNAGQTDIFKLEIDDSSKTSFLEMARWTKFLAILGFVMLGLLLIGGLLLSVFINTFAQMYGGASPIANMGPAGPVIIMAIFIVGVGVYIYPTYALFKYSTGIKSALALGDKQQFNRAVKYLKNMFRYIGVLTIIMLALYGVQMVFALLANLGK